jgi:hypothetical protein
VDVEKPAGLVDGIVGSDRYRNERRKPWTHRTKNTTLAPTSSTLKSNLPLALGSIGVVAPSQLQSATKAHDRSAKESRCVAADQFNPCTQ